MQMAKTLGEYSCLVCDLVFETEDQANHHEEQHPRMIRKSATALRYGKSAGPYHRKPVEPNL
jgi:hypothetical protein